MVTKDPEFHYKSPVFGIIRRFLPFVIGITNGLVFGLSFSQNDFPVYSNQIFDSSVHTILLRNPEWELSLPVAELGSNLTLELRFDDLSHHSRNFAYTLIHCDANWKKSDLAVYEYMTGRGEGILTETEYSFNTTYDFVHYRLVFPNEDCMPVISGNYVIVVYIQDHPEEVVFTRQFYLYEKTVEVEASVRQPVGPSKETGQQIKFSLIYNPSEIKDAVNDMTAVAIQNNRPDRRMVFKGPYSAFPGRSDYTDPDGGIFEGGNEFRSLDIKSMRYQPANIQSIGFPDPYYHVMMKPDESRSNKPYFSNTDLNGDFYIDREKSDNRNTEADYVYVQFRLKLAYFYTGDKVFVSGQFNNWLKNQQSEMTFNETSGYFEKTVLLKQGLYDYCFMSKNEDTGIMDESRIEGSFYETENDYTIFVYYHDRFKRYDHLAGYLSIK